MSGHIGRSFIFKELIMMREIQLNPKQVEAVSKKDKDKDKKLLFQSGQIEKGG
jgi:hypothetical protein